LDLVQMMALPQEDKDEDRGRTHRPRHDVRAAAAPRSRDAGPD
jgi:hypothetical protein